MSSDVDLALVGVVLAGVENHSLATLATAARACGASARVVPFSGWLDMECTLESLFALQPRVCGVSLQTGEAALATMGLIKLLRERGFDGRIVCGGHFATLQAEALLRINPALDAVVRFAGEEALCGLLRGSLRDDELAQLPGMVFRAADGTIRVGAPARIRAPGALDSALLREGDAPLHLGFGASDLIVSQGCEANCGYCCVAGATKLAGHEQQRADLPRAPYHRQSIVEIADTIAALYFERRTRVFNFMDDNVLPLDPNAAGAWATQLRRALVARDVGPIAFSMQLRADALTPESTDALVALGLVRSYVGIDGYSAPQLHQLGRRADPDAGARALTLLWERGVFAVANALLIGPTIPFESIAAEIEGLARIQHAPVHLLPIEARSGTRYFDRAERLGLLEGGFLLQHYRFADPRTELLGRVVTSMPTRLAERSVPIALYDLGYNLGIARRLLPEAELARCVTEYARISAAWNRDQVRLLREAATAAQSENAERVQALIARELTAVTAHDQMLLQACDAMLAEVEATVSALRRRAVHAHARGKLLGAVALSMSLAGCSGARSSLANNGGGSGSAAISGAGAAAVAGSANDAKRDAGSSPVSTGRSRPDAGSSALPKDAALAGDGASGTCVVKESLPVTRLLCAGCGAALRIQFDAQGKASAFLAGNGSMLADDVRACLQAFIGDYCYPSLAGMTHDFTSHCWVA